MQHPQRLADTVRELIADTPAVQRLGIEVLWAAGGADALIVRARHRDRVLTLERGGAWLARPLPALARELAAELVGEALGTERAAVPPPYRPRSRRPSIPRT